MNIQSDQFNFVSKSSANYSVDFLKTNNKCIEARNVIRISFTDLFIQYPYPLLFHLQSVKFYR